MGLIGGFLRRLLLAAVLASVLLLLARYLFDLVPATPPALQGIDNWVHGLTQPFIVFARNILEMPPQTGLWNPLPLGMAVSLLVLGALGMNFLDWLFGPAVRMADDTPPARPQAHADPAATVLLPSNAGAPAPPQNATGTVFKPGNSAGGPAPIQGVITRPNRIGRYEVIDELGRGAMGVVYKARDPQIGRMVAIKTVLGGVVGDPAADDFKRRFFAEARAAGRLNHPGIMKVHDLVEDDGGHPCLVLEFFEGRTLDRLVADKRPTVIETLKMITQAAQALAFAHDNGVVHRDIKPGNIMVSSTGHTVITDFGIAKMEDVNLTATGTIMGTPAYMSPEQVQGLPVDKRTDIFSLGTVLYWLLTGERPFAGSTFTTIAYNVVHSNPRPPMELSPEVPVDIEPVITRCLAKAPVDRYASAHELAADLRGLKVG